MGGNSVEVFTSIHSCAEGGGLESTAADVEGPAHEGTDLVAIEVAVDVVGDAGVEFAQVLLKE